MREMTYNEIVRALSDFETTSMVFSGKRGRISVGAKNLTGAPGISGGPEVFFLVEEWQPNGLPPTLKRAHSLQEALWMLGIEKWEPQDAAVGLNCEEDGA